MKTIFSITIALLGYTGRAQAPDTLFTNENHNVALFFPEKIRQAVVGAENYVFSYNQEHPQFFGLLRGSAGKSSNLLAITESGYIYSYVLAYREELPRLVYFLESKAALGNESRTFTADTSATDSLTVRRIINQDSLNRKHLEKMAAYYYRTYTGMIKKKKKAGISLQLNGMIYNREQVYMVFEIENLSGIDFEPEFLRIFITQGNKRRNASYQEILQKPLLKHNFPQLVNNGQRKKFVYVVPKFTIGNREAIKIELRESNGNRLLKMQVRRNL